MNLENSKINKHHIPKALLVLSAALALLIGAKVSAYVMNSSKIPQQIDLAIKVPERCKPLTEEYKSKYVKASQALKEKSLFMAPVMHESNPVTKITAVFGDEVMIADKWYKIGDRVSDAEIKSISPNEVIIVWNERESSLKPFDSVEIPEIRSSRGRRDSRRGRDSRPGNDQRGDSVQDSGRWSRGRPDFSDDERRRRMEEFRKMSPEQRAKFIQQMRERRSRGEGGGNWRGDRGSRGTRDSGGSRGGGAQRGGGPRGDSRDSRRGPGSSGRNR